MKNQSALTASLTVLLIAVLGCSFYDPFSGGGGNQNSAANNDNRTLADKTIDSTVGREKIGVAECDEIIDFFADQAKATDEDFVTRAAREFALNKVKESFKQSIEQHQGDKAALAKNCREFKTQIDRFKAEEINKESK